MEGEVVAADDFDGLAGGDGRLGGGGPERAAELDLAGNVRDDGLGDADVAPGDAVVVGIAGFDAGAAAEGVREEAAQADA